MNLAMKNLFYILITQSKTKTMKLPYLFIILLLSFSSNGAEIKQKKSKPKPWTKREDVLLLASIKKVCPNFPKKPPSKWRLIAKNVPNRDQKQCNHRWTNQLDPKIQKKPWTIEEDFQLKKLYLSHGADWARIAKKFPGKTSNNVKNRFNSAQYRKNLFVARHKEKPNETDLQKKTTAYNSYPRIDSGKWTEVENRLLEEGILIFGNNWIEISKHVVSRSKQQCINRNRYLIRKKALENSHVHIKKGPWSNEEINLLEEALNEQGVHDFKRITQMVGTRTEEQCRGFLYRKRKREIKEEDASLKRSKSIGNGEIPKKRRRNNKTLSTQTDLNLKTTSLVNSDDQTTQRKLSATTYPYKANSQSQHPEGHHYDSIDAYERAHGILYPIDIRNGPRSGAGYCEEEAEEDLQDFSQGSCSQDSYSDGLLGASDGPLNADELGGFGEEFFTTNPFHGSPLKAQHNSLKFRSYDNSLHF